MKDWREDILEKMNSKTISLNKLSRGIGYTNPKHLEDALYHCKKDITLKTHRRIMEYIDNYEESK